MLRALLFLSFACSIWAGQGVPQSLPTAPRPVRDVTERPSAKDIEFVSFSFQQPSMGHVSVNLRDIKEEPSIGVQYAVQASIGGQEAIKTATFHAVDESGNRIERLGMARRATGVPDHSEFIGLMTVPATPFRIVFSGESIDGEPFSRTQRGLFKPVQRGPTRLPLEPGFSREDAAGLLRTSGASREQVDAFLRAFDEQAVKVVAEVEALIAENPTGKIVMPRAQVSNVTYAPLVSAAGRPIGIRIAYDVKFSQSGQFNPKPRVFAEDKSESSIGQNPMDVLNSAIDPLPREVIAPHDLASAEYRPSLLAYGADFVYQADTVYHFTADLVPNYIARDRDKTTLCISHQRFELAPDRQKAFARMLSSEGTTTTYRVIVGLTAYEGRIENFYGEGTFYKSFLEGGVQDCGPPIR